MTVPLATTGRHPSSLRRLAAAIALGAAVSATPSVVSANQGDEAEDAEETASHDVATEPAGSTPPTTTPDPETDPDDRSDDAGEPDDPGTPTTTLLKPIDEAASTPTPAPAAADDGPARSTGIDIRTLSRRVQHVLATIRYLESRNTYDIPPNAGNASGAYQFIESTWAGHGGYRHAYLAPPAVQDERAAKDVLDILSRFDGDVSMVPIMWYFPQAYREPALLDTVPKPEHGNVLTIRQYQTRWLSIYSQLSGERLPPAWGPIVVDPGSDVAADPVIASFERRAGLPPSLAVRRTLDGFSSTIGGAVAIAFPVLGPSRLASFDCADARRSASVATRTFHDGLERVDLAPLPAAAPSPIEAHGLCVEEAPGIVFGVKLQPVLAVVDGVVTRVDDEPGSDRPIAVEITSADGTTIEYRGFNDDSPGTDDGAAPDGLRLTSLAELGTVVRAGQIIGFMGDSDPLPPTIRADVPTDPSETLDSTVGAPHIRVTITDRRGRPLDAVGPLLDAQARERCRIGIGGWSVPPWEDTPVTPVTIETTDLHDDVDSDWEIRATGQVVATGWAALIDPGESCEQVSNDPFGPGEHGSTQWPTHWLEPYELPSVSPDDLGFVRFVR